MELHGSGSETEECNAHQKRRLSHFSQFHYHSAVGWQTIVQTVAVGAQINLQEVFGADPSLRLISPNDSQQIPATARQLFENTVFPSNQMFPGGHRPVSRPARP